MGKEIATQVQEVQIVPGRTNPGRTNPSPRQDKPRDTYRLKVRGWKEIFHENGNQKKAGIAILISDKIDFKIKNVDRKSVV